MAYTTKKEVEEAKKKWNNGRLQALSPAGYEQHKSNLAAYESGGAASKEELKAARKAGAKAEREELMSMYILKDMSGSSTEALLNYQPDYSGKVKFEEKMAEIRGIGAALEEKLSDQGKIKRIGGFEQNEKLMKKRGKNAEYDEGGRYLGGGKIPSQDDKYVDSKGKLQKITKEMKEADPYGQLAVQRTYDEYAQAPKKTTKSYTKLAKKLGIKNKTIKKSLKP